MRFFVALIVALWAFAFFSRECNLVVVTICMVLCCIFSLIPTLVIDFFKHDRNEAIKYVVICIAVFNCMILSSVFSHMALVVWIFPILLTSLYYNKTLVVFTALMSTVGVILADFINLTYCDFMVAPIYMDYTDSMVLSVFPCVITILILSLVAYFIVSRNSTMLNSVIDNAEEVKSNQKELIFAFAELSESKSKYTGEHIKRVADYMRVLGKASGFDDDYVDKLSTAAMMHDIGKLMISEEILDKPGKLTDEEYEIIKGHVEASIDIIRHLPSLDYVIPAVIGHHERYDGKGYPRRIAGEDIPLTARILCVADSFDAMTSKRCYKKAFPIEVAREKLLQDAGRQFDPDLVCKFVECLDHGSITLVKAEETVDSLKEML